MAPPLIALTGIRLRVGSTDLLSGADLSVSPGERLCVVGRNGSGKSTLLKIAAGIIEADGGVRFVQPGATVRYLPQEPDLSGFPDVLSYVKAGLGPGDDPYRARMLIENLGLTGAELPGTLSGGEARRAALARVLAPEPDILLLDEPTNHLDLPTIEWLEGELNGLRSALVVISHDRRFLERLSRRTIWLDRGRTLTLDRGFSAFEEWRDQVLAEEERDRQKLDQKIAAEMHWVRYGVTARRKRNVRRMRGLADLRQQRRDSKRGPSTIRMGIAESDVSGKAVMEADRASKSYDNRLIVADFSIRITRGNRIGIVGPNGAGKTTLLNLLTGVLAPDSGKVKLGTNLETVTLDQRREALDPNSTLAETLTGGRGDNVFVAGQPKHVIGYMKDFLFLPEQARSAVSVLSGGERGRLMLARAFAMPSNLMILDEPTNDLDLETLDLLEELLGDYSGTVLLVSHDRDFLDRVVTSVVAAEGNGRWTEYAGGYADMLAQRGADLGDAKRKADKAAPEPARAAQTARAPARARLTYKQKFALETLPKRIAELTDRAKALEVRLADPKLYARDPAAFGAATAELGTVRGQIEAAETEWLELEMLRESAGE